MEPERDPSANHLRVPVRAALEQLARLRRQDQIVVTNQMSARIWPTLSQQELDFNYNPSTMGGAVPLGLGLALACPAHEIIVITGEGALLMSLGSLVTVVDSQATNLTVIVLDNGMYEVTGGQCTPASQGHVDFAGVARSAGFGNVAQFVDIADWQARLPGVLAARGPRFLWLRVTPYDGRAEHGDSPPIAQRARALRQRLR